MRPKAAAELLSTAIWSQWYGKSYGAASESPRKNLFKSKSELYHFLSYTRHAISSREDALHF